MLNFFLIFSIINFKFVDVEKAVNKKNIDTLYLNSINFPLDHFLFFDFKIKNILQKEYPNYYNQIKNNDKNLKKIYKLKKIKLLNKYKTIYELINDYEIDYDLFNLISIRKKIIFNGCFNLEKNIFYYKNKYMFIIQRGNFLFIDFILEFNKNNIIYYYGNYTISL